MAARAAVRAVLGGGGEDQWATASDGEDGGGYELCPLRRRKARAERAIKFATDSATELCQPTEGFSEDVAPRTRFDEIVSRKVERAIKKGPVETNRP